MTAYQHIRYPSGEFAWIDQSHPVDRHEVSERTWLTACATVAGHAIYYWADGGLGKTRLLEELEQGAPGEAPLSFQWHHRSLSH